MIKETGHEGMNGHAAGKMDVSTLFKRALVV
jgi:hypothetical protein